MKLINYYQNLNITDEDKAFDYLLNTLNKTIKTYDFFVAWNKVLGNVKDIEIRLNILNTLIGKQNIEEELTNIISSYPEVVSVIPILIACRDKNIKIVEIGRDVNYSFITKSPFTKEEIAQYVLFAKETGLLDIFANKNIKNLVDYALGVEVGLDTNARKNRIGITMENLINIYIQKICSSHGFRYHKHATAESIQQSFGMEIPTDESDRIFDFSIKTDDSVFLIEVNYYSSGGSKLKAVAGEFKSLYNLVRQNKKVNFIWITDGLGWLTTKSPLRETFDVTDYILNIKMIKEGLLEAILSEGN